MIVRGVKNNYYDIIIYGEDMNIVFGGSFNPPTKAHNEIVSLLIKKFNPKKIILVPVGSLYNKKDLVSFEERLKMLKLMFQNNEKVVISEIEKDGNFQGTINTLRALSKDYDNIHFSLGTDQIKVLETWIDYKDLLKEYPLIIFKRDNDDIDEIRLKLKNYEHKFTWIEYENEISSTKFRSNRNKYKDYVDEKVFDYIKKHQLYRSGLNV